MNEVYLAIDFGNLKLRIGVRYNDKMEIVKNEERYSAFSQILIHKKEFNNLIFGFEADTNSIGGYNCCYREFKYNNLITGDKNDKMIVEILKYYKQLSEDYVNDRSNGQIQKIDKVILTIPSYDHDNENIWKELLIKCSKEAAFQEIITKYEDEAAIIYNDLNISEKNTKYYCIFNLGCLFFNSSIYEKDENSIRMKYTSSKCIYSNKVFRRFFDELQNLFDEKLKKKLGENISTKNGKYLAECYKKYHKLMDDFAGKLKQVQLEFLFISDDPIEIEITRNEIIQVLKNTHDEIQKLVDDIKEYLRVNQLDMASVTLLINGNGFRYPGFKELFIKEFPHNFLQRHVFYNEEIIYGALQNSTKYTFEFIKSNRRDEPTEINNPASKSSQKKPFKTGIEIVENQPDPKVNQEKDYKKEKTVFRKHSNWRYLAIFII